VLDRLGHSQHGSAFDTGPRQKPHPMTGIGEARFPITTRNPEVQRWFDQGNALLHSFADYDAERAFRWCLKLEPDNAMAYWGLARASMLRGLGGENRPEEMIRKALKLRSTVSEREQLYIDALAAEILPDPLRDKPDAEGNYRERRRNANKVLETLCVKYPDDMEARALLALNNMGDARYGTEMIIREVLSRQPDHPGAHHYRIHNWDYHEPEQALESARRYGEIVPAIGHALHMPGHIFSIVGMWNEAAISMDAATRAEKRYMAEELSFPFNNWNYGHNLNYLSYIQEQLGMFRAAVFGARQLIDAPLDPQANNELFRSSHSYGIQALSRALLKFEKWDQLLDDKTIPWRDIFLDKVNKTYFQARAHFARGEVEEAAKSLEAHTALKKDLEKNKGGVIGQIYPIQAVELRARLALARGQTLEGLSLLADAAQKEFDFQRTFADPPFYPQALYTSLGEAYLDTKSPVLAAKAFEKALELTKNDLFALSGAVRAYAASGETAKAKDAMARLLYVTADADKDLPVISRALATGITATPRDSSPGRQRNYLRTALEKYGPNQWIPYNAPALQVTDSDGKRVTLTEYRGRNILLVFYLGQECPHCMRQLHDIAKRKDDWNRLDTAVLAVSSALPDKNAKAIRELGELPIRLLSDDHFTNARRFHSYDDFEDMELHSTILIDRQGRVYWARTGGEPFSDMAFLVKQLETMNTVQLSRTGDTKSGGE
ncbi:MAG TPA: redoxin domain-containing protein, partial [Anaerolineales bacterium]|nr:redoxin domain-containing protein [Anaerolineales bacterium]